MVKAVLTAGSVLAMLAAGTAFGQSVVATGNSQIGSLTCGEISTLSAANQAALIYYAAGYRDGLIDGGVTGSSHTGGTTTTDAGAISSGGSDASGTSSSPADPGLSSAEGGSNSADAGGGSSMASDSTFVGGLGLDAQRVVTACASSASALITDVIGSSGGTTGTAAGSGASSDGATNTAPSGTLESSAATGTGTNEPSSSAQ